MKVDYKTVGMFLDVLRCSYSSEPWRVVQNRISDDYTVLKPLDEDRFPCSFAHIFSSGYAAGYYSYKWAEVSWSAVH